MKITLGCDHAGVEMKNRLAVWLRGEGHQVDEVWPERRIHGHTRRQP